MTTAYNALPPRSTEERFGHDQYLIKRQFFKLFGSALFIHDAAGHMVLYSKQKAFKLREDVRLYTDPQMTTEVLTIIARQIIDFSAAYDVTDPATGQKIGALRRKGFTSLIQDAWVILDPADRPVGQITEDNIALALIRRFATNLVPQTFYLRTTPNTEPLVTFRQHFNPFLFRLSVNFAPHANIDRRLGLAAAVLLSVIEGRQN